MAGEPRASPAAGRGRCHSRSTALRHRQAIDLAGDDPPPHRGRRGPSQGHSHSPADSSKATRSSPPRSHVKRAIVREQLERRRLLHTLRQLDSPPPPLVPPPPPPPSTPTPPAAHPEAGEREARRPPFPQTRHASTWTEDLPGPGPDTTLQTSNEAQLVELQRLRAEVQRLEREAERQREEFRERQAVSHAAIVSLTSQLQVAQAMLAASFNTPLLGVSQSFPSPAPRVPTPAVPLSDGDLPPTPVAAPETDRSLQRLASPLPPQHVCPPAKPLSPSSALPQPEAQPQGPIGEMDVACHPAGAALPVAIPQRPGTPPLPPALFQSQSEEGPALDLRTSSELPVELALQPPAGPPAPPPQPPPPPPPSPASTPTATEFGNSTVSLRATPGITRSEARAAKALPPTSAFEAFENLSVVQTRLPLFQTEQRPAQVSNEFLKETSPNPASVINAAVVSVAAATPLLESPAPLPPPGTLGKAVRPADEVVDAATAPSGGLPTAPRPEPSPSEAEGPRGAASQGAPAVPEGEGEGAEADEAAPAATGDGPDDGGGPAADGKPQQSGVVARLKKGKRKAGKARREPPGGAAPDAPDTPGAGSPVPITESPIAAGSPLLSLPAPLPSVAAAVAGTPLSVTGGPGPPGGSSPSARKAKKRLNPKATRRVTAGTPAEGSHKPEETDQPMVQEGVALEAESEPRTFGPVASVELNANDHDHQKTEESQGQAKVEEVPCAAEAQKADGVAVDGDCLTEGLSAHRAVEEGAGTTEG
eukprot:EG_transcript_3749